MTPHVMSIPFKDAQHLERMKFSVEDMARIFNLPAFVLGEDQSGQSYNSLEIKQRSVLDYAIVPHLVKWEQELNRKLLTKDERADGYYFEFDVGGFLRGDSKTQAEVHDTYARAGIMAPNEAREHLNMPRIEGGDVPWIELNRQPLDSAAVGQTQSERALAISQRSLTLPAREDREQREYRTLRSLAARYKLREAFFGVLEQNAGRIVDVEVKALRSKIAKIPDSGVGPFATWLESFFEAHERFAAGVMGPALFTYLEAVAREISEELERPAEEFAALVATFSAQYRDAFARRHAGAGRGAMEKIIRNQATGDDLVGALNAKVDIWAADGAGRIAKREATQGMGAISVAVYGAAGILRLVWDWPGGKCGICPKFHGRTVEIHKPFASPGDTVETPDGSGDYVVQSLITHPPAHGGCQCGVRPAL
jgi:hypothetical protein